MIARVGLPEASRPVVAGALALVLACLNVGLGVGLASGRMLPVAIGALLPAVLIGAAALAASNRAVLLYIALGIQFTTAVVNDALPIAGSLALFAADLLLALAVGAWLAGHLMATRPEERPSWLRTPVLGLPLLLLGVALFRGLLEGSERYGASLLGMPLRLALCAAIVTAISDVTPREAMRGITVVLYSGTVWLTGVAVYHIVTGTSQTEYSTLSTGGIRYLSTTSAIYLSAALVLALVNLGSHFRLGPRWLHLGIAGLAVFDVAVAQTRGAFIGLALVVTLLLLRSAKLRRSLLAFAPLIVLLGVLAVLLVPRVVPDLGPALAARLTAAPATDANVVWRQQAARVALAGVGQEPLLGIGFGREATFKINGEPNVITGDPHNGFIYLLAGGGVFALASFVLLLLVYLYDTWRRMGTARSIERDLIVWTVGSWAIFTLQILSEPVLTSPSYILTLWILMLLPAIVPHRLNRESPKRVVSTAHIGGRRPSPSGRTTWPARVVHPRASSAPASRGAPGAVRSGPRPFRSRLG